MQNFKTLAISVAEQAGLSLTWSETPKTGFLVTRLIYNDHQRDFKLPKLTCSAGKTKSATII